MIEGNFQEVCTQLGMSKGAFKSAFSQLKDRGFIFTPAKTVKEFLNDKCPIRIALIGPTSERKDAFSMGPFSVTKQYFDQHFLKLRAQLSNDELSVMMTFKRLEYEKFGAAFEQSIVIEADEDEFLELVTFSNMYDYSRPHVYSDYVWFDITDEYKLNGLPDFEANQSVEENWWWETLIKLDEKVSVNSTVAIGENNISSVANWFFEFPQRFLPGIVSELLPLLFSHLTLGIEVENLILDVNEIREAIRIIFQKHENINQSPEYVDRELLVKELCDYNGYVYPIDVSTTIGYLESIEIISRVENSTNYKFASNFKLPEEFFVGDEWEEKFHKYVETGSVLFAYLTLDEIVS